MRNDWAARRHAPEYLMEAANIAILMLAACVVGVVMEHPASPLRHAIASPIPRRLLAGVLKGLAALAIIHSPWGQQSGGHMNPAVTFTYLTLGKVRPPDAAFYVAAQLTGATLGVILAGVLLGPLLVDPAVNYVVTVPGAYGLAAAYWAEAAISLLGMLTVLYVSNHRDLSRWTPFFSAGLAATFIAVEGPVSGASMNPARSLGSAVSAAQFRGLWIYFTAPPLGMILASLLYRARYGVERVFCAKLHHHNNRRCIFECNYAALRPGGSRPAQAS